MKNNFWLLTIILFVTITLVIAAAPDWINGASDFNYTTTEEATYYHNFSANITGFNNDVNFSIDTATNIKWTNVSGTYDVSADDISDWILITNPSTGNLTINALYDNQTGFFVIPIQATNTSTGGDAITEVFEFIINATNDAPNFTLSPSYNTTAPISENTTKNITLIGNDEENQYPLEYNITFLNCTHASWSSRDNCNLTNEIINESNTTSILTFSNITYNDVGTYNMTICTRDNLNGASIPTYRDANYEENKSYCQNTTLNILSTLSIDISNCTGATLMEEEQFNCTINITTQGESDSLNISSHAFFRNDSVTVYDENNRDWFYSDTTDTATNFIYTIPISITPTKKEVGNWTINFTAIDTDNGDSNTEQINLYVNFTESNVILDTIDNITIYENNSFTINAIDDDLLIWDTSVKDESLTFTSNTTWVTATSPNTDHGINYSTSTVTINYDHILANGGEGNYTISINVTDTASPSNSNSKTFTIEIFNETAPEWNIDSPVLLALVEDTPFNYNVSINVSDAENDTITFYYQNVSAEFCSLNSSTFNSTSGIINFTPTDCDVGYHNVTIIASDGKLNSSRQFIFNITNIADTPSIHIFDGNNGTQEITEGFTLLAQEDETVDFSIEIDDDDFLIPSGQRANFYNESLTISVLNNSDYTELDLFNFSFDEPSDIEPNRMIYNATLTPTESQVGNYTIFINISDVSGNSTNRTFNLNITQTNDAPNLTLIENQSLTINETLNLDINATDEEDGNDTQGNLTFSLNFTYGNDFANGNESIFNTTSGIFNLSTNSTHVGEYHINVTVNDSGSPEKTDSQIFYIYIYGTPNITSPSKSYQFNWTEGVTTESIEFNVDYGVNNTNLTYEIYSDKIIYYWINQSNNTKGFNYTDLNNSLRETGNFTWNSSTNLSLNYTPDYEDESYDKLKNFSIIIYNPNYPSLNNTQTWDININHTNENISFTQNITKKGPVTKGTTIAVNLEDYFSDTDYFDIYYNQKVNFSLEIVEGEGHTIPSSSFNNWILNLGSSTATTERVKITAYEWSDENTSMGNVESNDFEVEFIEPTTTTTTTTRSKTKLKFYSLRIIVPQDIIVSEENYIEIPFSLQNTGTIDLSGIDLYGQVLYNNKFSDDIKILLKETFVPSLKVGQTEDYIMKILADTTKAGRYKVTLFANVTSPKFSDWGDFFIDLKRINESEAEQILIFTEKFIAENPECIELTELLNRAKATFDSGDFTTAIKIAQETTEACENAIESNEQIRHKIEGFVQRNFYYIFFITLIIFFAGFIFYIYKRVRFNKSETNGYL